MKEINTNDLKFIGGAGGRDLAQWGAGGAVLALTKNGQASLAAGYVAGELYDGISNGYQTAPGVTQGVGSYNPNYNPSLLGPWQPSGGASSFSLADIISIGWNRFQRDVWGI
ncbi:hypothetical protein E5C26_12740 [Serratia proteamaculans]|jgi:hypothetical protein|uniref:hypothetical protein n=1 Tax=Serratia proteamaculans TaxID=28151 RepID=UPI001075F26E|nr:hypothetical protein [Serratia proteamaculans]TFZ51219.1 hypothetical protein E5C26_12740 [Serratia proteamaculans]